MFFVRLRAAPAASTFDEAFSQLHDILDAVEDTHSGVPYNPPSWQTDGRMYAPFPDSEKLLEPPRPSLRMFKARHHKVYIGANGAIEIQLKSDVVFDKPGADSRRVLEFTNEPNSGA